MEHGVVCNDRAAKYEAWEQDKQAFKTKDGKDAAAKAASGAFAQSDSVKAFQAALAQEGLSLARGKRRGLVVVSRGGEIYALTRLISLEDGTDGRD